MSLIDEVQRRRRDTKNQQVVALINAFVADARGDALTDSDVTEAGAIVDALGVEPAKLTMVARAIQVRETALRQQREAEANYGDYAQRAADAKATWQREVSKAESLLGPLAIAEQMVPAPPALRSVNEKQVEWQRAEDAMTRAMGRAHGEDVDRATKAAVEACRAAGLVIETVGAVRVDPLVTLLTEGRLPEADEAVEHVASSTEDILARLAAKKAAAQGSAA